MKQTNKIIKVQAYYMLPAREFMDGACDTQESLQIRIQFVRQSRHTTTKTLETNKQIREVGSDLSGKVGIPNRTLETNKQSREVIVFRMQLQNYIYPIVCTNTST